MESEEDVVPSGIPIQVKLKEFAEPVKNNYFSTIINCFYV